MNKSDICRVPDVRWIGCLESIHIIGTISESLRQQVPDGSDIRNTWVMNISNDEFMAVLDDVIAALQKNNMPQRVQEEVLYIFFSMKSEVVGQ